MEPDTSSFRNLAQQSANDHQAEPQSADLEDQILSFGREVFKLIGSELPGAFSTNFWSSKIMQWSMTRQDLKVNMFRLVDVLPTLRDSAAVASHIQEYLAGPGGEISPILRWGASRPPHSLSAKVAASFVKLGVRKTAEQFIAGETPTKSLQALNKLREQGLAFTCDLLGEYCVSEVEAQDYLSRYLEALDILGNAVPKWESARPIVANHRGEITPTCISVKLTALYSQCSVLNFERSVAVLAERLTAIVAKAKAVNALIYVDAEDCGNNPIIYEVFKRVFSSPEYIDFPFPGIVVQAYAKQAGQIIADLLQFANRRDNPIAIRLVKGAYYDHETVIAAQNGWESPLFTKKVSSDANYERLSRLLLDNIQVCLPAFGSHNIRSLSHACCYAESRGIPKTSFELQMLFGMAEPIARAFSKLGYLTRLYVPLGSLIPGMGYLVRRLLENTSNESFLKHTFFDAGSVESLLRKPIMED